MKKIIIFWFILIFSVGLFALEPEDLFYVVSTGQSEEYKKLKTEIFDINSRDKYGRTLLIAAVYGILDFQHKNSGNTALHAAAENGDFETAELLLKSGADAYVFDGNNQIPYLIALKNQNTATAEIIFKYMQSGKVRIADNSVTNFIIKNYIPIIEDLSEKNIDVNLKDFSGNSALHYAVRSGMVDIVKLLIDKGANVNIISEETKKSALILSSEAGFVQITDLLLSKGADANIAYTSAVTSEIKNPASQFISEVSYYEEPRGYNLKIVVKTDETGNPDSDTRCYYKIYIDKVEAGRTSVGLESQNKIFTALVDANKHLLRIEKFNLDETQKKYIQVNNIYQPDPDFVYFETFNDRILQINIVHTSRNIKSVYDVRFVKKGEL